jgi:hypothetical protein
MSPCDYTLHLQWYTPPRGEDLKCLIVDLRGGVTLIYIPCPTPHMPGQQNSHTWTELVNWFLSYSTKLFQWIFFLVTINIWTCSGNMCQNFKTLLHFCSFLTNQNAVLLASGNKNWTSDFGCMIRKLLIWQFVICLRIRYNAAFIVTIKDFVIKSMWPSVWFSKQQLHTYIWNKLWIRTNNKHHDRPASNTSIYTNRTN